jgi:hypothetical protein
MKTIFFLAMAMLAYSLMPAHAEPMPKDFLGPWCFEGETNRIASYSDGVFWYKGKCPSVQINFRRDGYDIINENHVPGVKCKYVSIKWFCPKCPQVIDIVARCIDRVEHEDGPRFVAKLNLALNRVRELSIKWED